MELQTFGLEFLFDLPDTLKEKRRLARQLAASANEAKSQIDELKSFVEDKKTRKQVDSRHGSILFCFIFIFHNMMKRGV